MIMKKQLHVYFSGTVQGVGFRYTAERLASGMGVGGWVKNLPDGRVELLCEGEEDRLAELLRKITGGIMREYISDTDAAWSGAAGELQDFEIRHW